MEELIKQAFLHVDVIGPHVQAGHYDLLGPDGEIILPQVWDKVIEPDWAITMHMWPMDRRPADPMAGRGMPPGARIPGGGPMPGPHGGMPGMRPPGMGMGVRPGGIPMGGQHGPPPPPHPNVRPAGMPQGHHDPRIIAVGPEPKKPKKKAPKSSGGFLGFMAGKPPSKTKKSAKPP